MSRKIEVQIVGDSSSLHRALGTATGGTTKLGSAFGRMARIAGGVGLALGGLEVLKFGKDAVLAAAQTQKANESIRENFGKSGKAVIDFNEHAAAGFGISAQSAAQFATQIGLMTTNIGLSKKQGADMTVGLEKLAGSVALIKGQDPAATFGKLNKALLGNTRGLKDMGIAITPVGEKLQAMKDGFIGPKGTISTLTSAQRAQVIYGLAVKHLPTLLDQAKQHSHDFADQIIVLKARLTNLADDIGKKILPVVSGLTTTLGDIAAAPSFTVGVEILFHGIEKGAKSIAEGIKHALTGSTSSFKIEAPSGKLLGHGSTFSKGIIQNIADGLRGADWSKIGAEVGKGIGNAIHVSSAVAGKIVSSITDGIQANMGKIGNTLAQLGIVMMLELFQNILDPNFWITHWKLTAAVAINAVLLAFAPESKFATVLKDLPILGPLFKGMEKMIGGPLLAVLKRLGSGILKGIEDVFPGAAKGGAEIGRKIISPLRSLPGRALGIIEDVGRFIGRELGNTARQSFKEAVRIGSRIVDGLDNFIGAVGNVASRLATRFLSPIVDLVGRVARPIAAVGRRILSALGGFIGSVFSKGVSMGRAIMGGIGSGLSQLMGWLEGKIAGIAGGLLDKAKGILHISSPSQRFADEVGRPIAEGIALGITRHAHKVTGALAGAVSPGGVAGMAGSGGGGGTQVIQLVVDRRVLAEVIRDMDKDYRRQNSGRPLLSGR